MISQNHLDMLAASGITPEFAELRGYETIRDRDRLAMLGYSKGAQLTQGLLIPQHRKDGSVWGYTYRPDHPRELKGKSAKYEMPYGQHNHIDVPAGVADKLGDPSIPLWVTEGNKKGDCGALHGLCIVALLGVAGWRGTNTTGGKTAVADWNDIALNGRRVILGFDGDVARKQPVQLELCKLADYLKFKGARVEYLHLPDGDDKTGIDDYLVAHEVEDLWRLVKPELPPVTKPGDNTSGQRQPEPPKPRPVLEPIDGAELLDQIDEYLARFVVYPSEYQRGAHALWIVHSWLMDCWESTPRFAFLSPEPGSGKSRALEVTEPLVPSPVHAINTTSAYLFRKVADPDGKPTILYDEIDTVFGPKARENEDIRGLLNAGHRKGAVAGRCVVRGKVIETEELDAYCAVMLAGLDDLPDTLMSRAVVVRMKRRAASEPIEPWRPRLNGPQAHILRDRIAAWAASVKSLATSAWPVMPSGVEDRNADVWEALLAVADLAGGHWPETARVAAVADVADVAASRGGGPSIGVLLLRDIRDVFNKLKICSLVSDLLITELKGIEESPWLTISKGEPLNANGLTRRLGKYGIGPKAIRVGERVLKGYTRAQFEDAWMRYVVDPQEPPDDDALGHPLGKPATSATSATSGSLFDTEDTASTPPRTSLSHYSDPSTNGAQAASGAEQNLCIDCGAQPPSAGRPRCNDCHRIHTQLMAGYDQ